MVGIPYLHLAALSFFAVGCAFGAEIPVQFNLLNSTRAVTYSFSTGNTSRQEIQQNGTINAVLSFDPETQRPTAIRFTHGVVRETSATFTNSATIHFYGFGKKQVTIVRSSSGIQFTIYTIGSAHPIDPNGKVGETNRLQTFPTAGILTSKITIDGRRQTQTIDVATNPPDFVKPSTGTEMYLHVIQQQDHGATGLYKVVLNTSVNASHSEQMPNTDTTVTDTTMGTDLAEAVFSAPNKYGQWLLDNGYSLNDEHSSNQQGIHLAALFAFNMSAHDMRGMPWSFTEESGTPVLTLRLPNGGLEKGIQVQTCEDPLAGDWQALREDDFLDGNSNLDRDASGTRRIRLSKPASQFFRIVPGGSDN